MRSAVLAAVLVLASSACDQTSKIDDAAKQARKTVDDAKKAVDTTIDDAKKAAARTWAGLTDTGELSKDALQWMASNTEDEDIRKVLAKGAQVAPVALEIAKTVNAAVDSETAVEPIYQSLEGRDPAEVDKAISSMSRVEVIDGLKVGFDQLSRVDASTKVDETAYLVTWRHEDHLVGFVYRTKSSIDIDMLVKEAPRLVAMTKAAIAEP